MIYPTIFVITIFSTILFVHNTPLYVDDNLLEIMFKNTSDLSLELKASTKPVDLRFGIELTQLLEVNERSQYITTKLWVRQSWKNPKWSWDPNQWGGLQHLYAEPNKVWRPDIVLYNDADLNTFAGGLEKYKTFIVMYPDGTQVWNAPASFKSTCKMNVRYFPFDTQICHMKFGSWAFDASMMRLSVLDKPLITEQYLVSSTWDLVDFKANFHSVKYKCCEHPFHDITFSFVMRRRPLYYMVNIVAPCVVLVFMVLFSFMLSPSCRIRLSINITILLALTMFLHMLGGMLPQNADTTPVLSTFFITLMSECAFALMIMIIVRTIHNRGIEKDASPPPKWAKKLFFNVVAKYIGPKSVANLYDHEKGRIPISTEPDACYKSMRLTRMYEKNHCPSLEPNDSNNILLYTNQDILKEVTRMNKQSRDYEKRASVEEEWKALSKTIDRLSFILCLFIFLISACSTMIIVYSNKHYEIKLTR